MGNGRFDGIIINITKFSICHFFLFANIGTHEEFKREIDPIANEISGHVYAGNIGKIYKTHLSKSNIQKQVS